MKRKKITDQLPGKQATGQGPRKKIKKTARNRFRSHVNLSTSNKTLDFFINKLPVDEQNKKTVQKINKMRSMSAEDKSLHNAKKRMTVYKRLLYNATKNSKMKDIEPRDFKKYYSFIKSKAKYLVKLEKLSKKVLNVSEALGFMVDTNVFDVNVWDNILSFLHLGYMETILLSPLLPNFTRGCFRNVSQQIDISDVEMGNIKIHESLFCELFICGKIHIYDPSDMTIRRLRKFSSIYMSSTHLYTMCDLTLKNIFHPDIKKIKSVNSDNIKLLINHTSKVKNIEHLNFINVDPKLRTHPSKIEHSIDASNHPKMKIFISNCIRLDNYKHHRNLKTVRISDAIRLIDIIRNTEVSDVALSFEKSGFVNDEVFNFITDELLTIKKSQLDIFKFGYPLNNDFGDQIKRILFLLISNVIKNEFICTDVNDHVLIIKKIRTYDNLKQTFNTYMDFTLRGRYNECRNLINILIKMTNNTLVCNSISMLKTSSNAWNDRISNGIEHNFKIKIKIIPTGQKKWLKAKRYDPFRKDIFIMK